MAQTDYAANFEDFLSERDPNAPFSFWLGTKEPHRAYEKDSWKMDGRDLSEVKVPAELETRMVEMLTAQKDPRILGTGDIFDYYPYQHVEKQQKLYGREDRDPVKIYEERYGER